MRSPVIAFSILAAAAVSPSLVSAAPASSSHLENAVAHPETFATHSIRSGSGFPIKAPGGGVNPTDGLTSLPIVESSKKGDSQTSKDNVEDPRSREEALKKAQAQTDQPSSKGATPAAPKISKRAGDQNTAGGNAYSGAASDSSGGDVQNEATDGPLANADGSNGAGGAGSSFSGFAFGGNGEGHGAGGNAYTGATGASRGGNVVNTSEGGAGGDGGDTGGIENTTANNAGGGGFSESGSAGGGDAAGPRVPDGIRKRAGDAGTAGGNAYSGATNDVSGGSVVNEADDESDVTNDGGNTAGGAGTTFSGDADGGNGNGFGPGGNAYSGASGPAVGGSVYNSGGTIDNAADSNAAGGGGVSETGDATGGRA